MKLTKPLVFIRLQAAGRHNATKGNTVTRSRIASLEALKMSPDGTTESSFWLVPPTWEADGTTGFTKIAEMVRRFMGDCDFAGFNLRRFDLPLLSEEFARAGIKDYPAEDVKVVDIQAIFGIMERRDLAAAVKFYLDKDYTNQTSAPALFREVLEAQLDRYEIPKDVSGLADFSAREKKYADFAGMLEWKDERLCYAFGKHMGKEITEEEKYLSWFLCDDFPYQSQAIAARYAGADWFFEEHEFQPNY